jgi:restriction system protein
MKSKERDPDKVWLGDTEWYLDLTDYTLTHDGEQIATLDPVDKSVLLRTVLVQTGDKTPEGLLVKAPTATWFEISKQLNSNPEFRYQFSAHPTKFEEFLAGAYQVEGWEAVTITPRSGDKGRDIIAVTKQLSALRVLDQAKAYGAGKLVSQNDVRALLGVLALDLNATKGIITTTSDFAPGVEEEFENVMPYRLETKNGQQFVEWIRRLVLGGADDP